MRISEHLAILMLLKTTIPEAQKFLQQMSKMSVILGSNFKKIVFFYSVSSTHHIFTVYNIYVQTILCQGFLFPQWLARK